MADPLSNGEVFTESVDTLLTQLCKLQLEDDQKRAYLIQPLTSRDDKCKRLKRKAYNTLFEFHRGRDKSSSIPKTGAIPQEVDGVLTYAYHLRCGRKFDEASRLESLLEGLLSNEGDCPVTEIRAVLQFLLLLSESTNQRDRDIIGHTAQKLPLHHARETEKALLPSGPRVYGDSQVTTPQSPYYMHYPRELFEATFLQADIRTQNDVNRPSLFELPPGTNLSGEGLFTLKPLLNDSHEKEARLTLFGALVEARVTSLDAILDLPDLPDESDMKCPEIKIPKNISSSQLSDDQGFCSDVSTSVTGLSESGVEENIWDLALTYVPSKHYTWERIGCVPGPVERPYLTEGGPQVVDEWYEMMTKQVRLIDPNVLFPMRVKVNKTSLIKDIVNLLLGIKSETFNLDETRQRFHLKPGTYVSGHSPDGLQVFLQDFIDCGSSYHQLWQFSCPPVIDSFYELGLIYQAFTGAVRKVLQHYRAVILSLPQHMSLMYLKFRCNRIFQQIRFLATLCWCQGKKGENSKFPTGISLLTYLYKETMETVNTDNYPMMLSILQTTCGPYTVFVQDWAFHGIYRDIYGEFTIQVNHQYLECRDKLYWTRGYTLAADHNEHSVPLFLRDVASDIFICGKTINLLKICCPEHFICQVDNRDIPQVTVTFSERELSTLDIRCQMFTSKMYQIATQVTVSREQLAERAEQAKRDLMEKAHTAATQEIARLQAKIDERKRAADIKKRQEFHRLKSQMVTDLQRRASEKEQKQEEDKEHMARLTRDEAVMDSKELELEREAREELIKFYADLSEEAAKREQKALWKVRRARLETAREEFLISEEKRWTLEMEEATQAKAVLERDQDIKVSLPDWANKASDDPNSEPKVADDTDPDSALPKWAEKGLSGPAAAVYGLDTSGQEDMPDWARKGLDKYDENTVVVDGGNGDGPDVDALQDGVFVSPPKRTTIKMNDSFSANMESEASPEKMAIRVFDDSPCTKESEEPEETKPQVKLMSDRHATTESSAELEQKATVKMSQDMHATKMSESEAEERVHIKTVDGIHVNKQSTATEELSAPKLKRHAEQHANVESESKEWKIKKQSFFGHASKLSGLEYDLTAPRLKRVEEIYANMQSDTNDFAIRPKIKINKAMTANTESVYVEPQKPGIKLGEKHVSQQSEYVDMDEVRLKKFKLRNVFGHSSDSSVQKLLYGETFGSPDTERKNEDQKEVVSSEIAKLGTLGSMWLDNEIETYTDNFDFLNDLPKVDLMSMTPMTYGGWGDYGISVESDVDAFRYMPLPALLHKSMTAPLKAQSSLVNKCIIDYFFSELKIQSHFEALRRFLLMGDGDFAQILSDILLEKLGTNPLPQEMLNPIFLNGALNKALQSSMHSDDKYADNLSFALKYHPAVLKHNAHDTLDCLELRYKVDWPLNIVLTDSCMSKYGRIFSFMLQLKRIVWVLKDVWHRLKRDSLIYKAGNSPQFRRLQLHRQEMQHFVKVMQGYISNQIILLTWSELLDALTTSVRNLDDLHFVHAQYLEKAIFRSLQNKKAKPVMKIIQDIFCLILKFQSQLVHATWCQDPNTGEVTHPNFTNMVASYQAFREYSIFLFKVVNKLAIRGYQPHLQELLLRLNFNNYYDST